IPFFGLTMASGDCENVKIGIIGGTGLESFELFEMNCTKTVNTPYGSPSSELICGTLHGVDCIIIARHGKVHDIMPSDINNRLCFLLFFMCIAFVLCVTSFFLYASSSMCIMWEEGCTLVLATTACGSLRAEYEPTDFAILDQFIDRTTKRDSTFYDGKPGHLKGVCHISMRNPFSEKLRQLLIAACEENGVKHHKTGTAITIEGPRFSTYAESHLYRSWGGSIINMTTVPEVVLAAELGLLYASLALVTDYDCWRDDYEAVSVEHVMQTMAVNKQNALKVIATAVANASKQKWSDDI
uniref:S-methyl-5'-thioadenosine phosphorylase n=1 Tax=Ciona savignyi TaxID=51511 RepID=H2YTP5_CIOSA